MRALRARSAMLAFAVSPLLALGLASPAHAETKSCYGIAPVDTSCTATGVVSTSPLTAQQGPNFGFTGTTTMTVTTATSSIRQVATWQAGIFQSEQHQLSGSPSPGQTYTLRVTASGTGYFSATVTNP